ncbi:MAG: hypothetical protein CSA81_06185 [Acidobacteria bacterium]|nr:MAG: hypothetical protein CSA81_06185 [Acidobacteriota bacterium]
MLIDTATRIQTAYEYMKIHRLRQSFFWLCFPCFLTASRKRATIGGTVSTVRLNSHWVCENEGPFL